MDHVVPVCETDSGSDFSDQNSDLEGGGIYLKSCSTQSLNDESVVEVLDAAQIVDHMKESIGDIADIIEEDFTIIRLLLSHFGWDKQALLERFYEQDKDALFVEANIMHLSKRSSQDNIDDDQTVFADALQFLHTSKSDVSAERDRSDCGICMTAVDQGFSLSCKHTFCNECWNSYLRHGIMNEGMSQNITCPEYKCFTLVDDATVIELVDEPKVIVKYQQLISNSFVGCNKKLRWCPAPGCGKAIKADTITKNVTCTCGERFCFQCGEKWHNPVKCDWIRFWSVKCSTDSSTTSWIASNTKECPRCNATIEKDGGCNHMVCRKDNCMYEFCWVCMGSWQDHGQNAWYNCNRFNEKSSKDARTAMETSRASMLRFLHYYNRFSNHQKSMTFESELYDKVNTRISELRDGQGQAWNEVKFIKIAVDVLCRARQILMNTYIFAYFVVQSNQSMIFEDNQRDLELATEQLSEYLERDIMKKGIEGLKQKVNDKASYCAQRCAVLVSHIQEGYDSGWWELCVERRRVM